jgi:biotin carboxylase
MSLVEATPRVLILALSNWFGAPRLPRAFRRAGFHVSTLAFPGLLIQRSSSIDEAHFVSEAAKGDALVSALLAAIERTRADIVIPTDDTTILVLHSAAKLAEQRGAAARTKAVLAGSLGDFAQLATLRSRKLLNRLAAELGVRVPRYAEVFDEAPALALAAEHGYPIVLKQEDTIAGMGVSICRSEPELRAALLQARHNQGALEQGLLAQTFVAGRTAMRVVVAREGRVLAGLSALKLETWPDSKGPSTCVEIVDHSEMKSATEAVIAALGYSGFASLDFMVDGAGSAHLIELNPRPTPIAHLGERFGACLCQHLFGALTGQPTAAGEPRGLPSRVALFPQEWVRDSASVHLAAGVYHDVPWDEPDLVEAYVRFARGQMGYSLFRAAEGRNRELRNALAVLEPAT